ncbi:unnamed protein product [Psylliodes chrysocephalus]|uniref:Regulatory protein zeste n=1 Tax=Psylliodes chrysocephalus TaxID=3402493 RepID=A0A9P0CY34_9CUCU|nr:unnamed protein product [Psylliodes chrysocephala]
MLPQVVEQKEKGWIAIKKEYIQHTGKEITVGQLKKLLNNMKSSVKKKTDILATGNKKIKLLEWEKVFLRLMKSDENPVFVKVPGDVDIGAQSSTANKNLVQNISPISVDIADATTKVIQHTPKKRKLQSETEETAHLSTSELQRLVLLEQLRLTRLQITREELLIKRLQESDARSIQQNRITSEYDTDGVLQVYLVLK